MITVILAAVGRLLIHDVASAATSLTERFDIEALLNLGAPIRPDFVILSLLQL